MIQARIKILLLTIAGGLALLVIGLATHVA